MRAKENTTENFEISFLSGIIQIINAPDYEKTQFYRFNVEASDNDGLESTASVVVYVVDVNDNAPMFLETSAHVSVSESISNSFILHTVQAVDNDYDDKRNNNPNNFVQYAIAGGNEGDVFNIDRYKGWVFFFNIYFFIVLRFCQGTFKPRPFKMKDLLLWQTIN